jgi:hypothetical protein
MAQLSPLIGIPNQHFIPYMWGTHGVPYNEELVLEHIRTRHRFDEHDFDPVRSHGKARGMWCHSSTRPAILSRWHWLTWA